MGEIFGKIIDFIRDPGQIAAAGYPLLALVIFIETGAFAFFLPGDSLLVVAGMYAADGKLNVLLLNAILIPCAILGDACSYWIGAKMGPKLFKKPESRFFKPKYVKAAHDFYERHGGKAIIIARFVPIVRTFVPVVAGVAGMTYRRFATFNIVGGASWVASMTFAGYFLGKTFPWLAKRMELVIIAVVVLSITPMIVEFIRARRRAARAREVSSSE
jgi:membrane-associated protein